ncbi:glycosyl hydrolase 5 family protein-like [Macadamia integrifolia]|uniref:glycosyl hydrolase 5 family protein-like n=1 Tax=Macadamia integrifolia TaxID=60698 RepID=UPI001C4FC766|nr:glycosyl hydrolase 5 family protein-like [Macadamia integrifolia]
MKKLFLSLFLSSLVLSPNVLLLQPVTAWLHTKSRWIVGEDNIRVKLTCVNWPSHLEPLVPEGLNKQPVDGIVQRIASMGFNCVRLTWPLYMVVNESYSTITVQQMFQSLNLHDALAGIAEKNPSLVHLSILSAYKEVVNRLGKYKVMVILDNHITKPGWCCSRNDGNGFFNDPYFDPDVWIKGLTRMATLFNNVPAVVGMSLRNELRGNRQNVNDWYNYMQKGANAVNAANPNVLVILSGLNSDNDLAFLGGKKPVVSFQDKLVFELHWYSFSDGPAWTYNSNKACAITTRDKMKRGGGFLLQQGFPLFVSEFGVAQTGVNVGDNKYFSCFFSIAADLDWDWAIWTLGGSYYLREGIVNHGEIYSMLDENYDQPRNLSLKNKITSGLQYIFQDPGAGPVNYLVMYHPSTGLCVLEQSETQTLKLGPCDKSQAWDYTTEKTLLLNGLGQPANPETSLCLQADVLGQPAKLGRNCTETTSKWEKISDSGMHLSINGAVCLDIDSSNTIITNTCKCLTDNTCDPSSQWFKLVTSSRSPNDSLPHRHQT